MKGGNRRIKEINHINNPSAIQPSDQIINDPTKKRRRKDQIKQKGVGKIKFFLCGLLKLQKVKMKMKKMR